MSSHLDAQTFSATTDRRTDVLHVGGLHYAGEKGVVERTLGMRIAGRTIIDDVTFGDLVDEGRSWGMTERVATRTVSATTEAIRAALDVVDPVIPDLRALIANRLDQLTSRP